MHDDWSTAIQSLLVNIDDRVGISAAALGVISNVLDALCMRLLANAYWRFDRRRRLKGFSDSHSASEESVLVTEETVAAVHALLDSPLRDSVEYRIRLFFARNRGAEQQRPSLSASAMPTFTFSAGLVQRRLRSGAAAHSGGESADAHGPLWRVQSSQGIVYDRPSRGGDGAALPESAPSTLLHAERDVPFEERLSLDAHTVLDDDALLCRVALLSMPDAALHVLAITLEVVADAMLREVVRRVLFPGQFPSLPRKLVPSGQVRELEATERMVHDVFRDESTALARARAALTEPLPQLSVALRNTLTWHAERAAAAAAAAEAAERREAAAAASTDTDTDTSATHSTTSSSGRSPSIVTSTESVGAVCTKGVGEEDELVEVMDAKADADSTATTERGAASVSKLSMSTRVDTNAAALNAIERLSQSTPIVSVSTLSNVSATEESGNSKPLLSRRSKRAKETSEREKEAVSERRAIRHSRAKSVESAREAERRFLGALRFVWEETPLHVDNVLATCLISLLILIYVSL